MKGTRIHFLLFHYSPGHFVVQILSKSREFLIFSLLQQLQFAQRTAENFKLNCYFDCSSWWYDQHFSFPVGRRSLYDVTMGLFARHFDPFLPRKSITPRRVPCNGHNSDCCHAFCYVLLTQLFMEIIKDSLTETLISWRNPIFTSALKSVVVNL